MRDFIVRLIAAIAFCGVIGFGGYNGALSLKFLKYPQHAVPSEGRTVPCPIKSIVVFVTPSEKAIYDQTGWGALGSGAVLLLYAAFETLRRKSPHRK